MGQGRGRQTPPQNLILIRRRPPRQLLYCRWWCTTQPLNSLIHFQNKQCYFPQILALFRHTNSFSQFVCLSIHGAVITLLDKEQLTFRSSINVCPFPNEKYHPRSIGQGLNMTSVDFFIPGCRIETFFHISTLPLSPQFNKHYSIVTAAFQIIM